MNKCYICKSRATGLNSVLGGKDSSYLSCEQCGEFEISSSAVSTLGKYTSPEDVIKLSGWVLHENRKGNIPALLTGRLEDIVNLPIPGHKERMLSLLIELVSIRKEVGMMINVTREPKLFAATYTSQGGHEEIMGLARMLEDQGLVKVPGRSEYGTVRVTSKGYGAVDRFKQPQSEKRILGFQL